MKRLLLFSIMSCFVTVSSADLADDIFDFCDTCNEGSKVDVYYIREYGFSNWHTNHVDFKSIVNTISNDYTRVLSSLSHFETNKLERTVFFTLVPYAGIDAWTNVWDGMLSIAETNKIACTPEWVNKITYAATTPLEYYMVYNYYTTFVSNALVRMITLVEEDNIRRKEAYQSIQSGEHKQYLIEVCGMPTNRYW